MPDPSEEARTAFARLFERIDRGEAVDLEAEIAAAGPLAAELRALAAGWKRAEGAFADLSDHASASGGGLHGDVALDGESAAVLARLGGRERSLSGSEPSSARYERLELVARGGMGEVWRVRDHDLGREVAMKVIHASSGPETRRRAVSLLERFLHEARLLARLDHPGILPLHDVGLDDDGRVWFTLPLVRGDTLADLLARKPASDAALIEILLRVCDALAYAHAQGVVHRDLKPSNVLVGRYGEAYVVDWGLARAGEREPRSPTHAAGPRRASETRHGEVVGTPAYMPPEQAAGIQGEPDPRADVYALGAILYHALSGHAPYEPAASTSRDVLSQVRQGPPEPIERVAPHAPVELVAICAKAMQRDPGLRYASVAALADDLRAHLAGRVVRAHRTGALPELVAWTRRNRALALALSGVLAIFAIGLIAWSLQRTRTAREVLRMADVARLSDLEERANRLGAADTQRAAMFEQWLAEAETLAGRRAWHESSLADVRERALPPVDGTPRFASDEDRWRHEVLDGLVAGLARLSEPDPARGGIARVRHLLATAREIERASLVDALPAWRATIAEIADSSRSPQYDGLQLAPQRGLVPLGRDADSGLQEFGHVASGELPRRDASGRLALADGSGIVLVLLPGGRFRMGATAADGSGPADADPWARAGEGPRRTVEIGPFFAAKHELSRAQWERTARSDPSWHAREQTTQSVALLPLESVDWTTACQALQDLGLTLPTEAQWEYAARGGTSSRWWCGNEPGSLRGVVNGRASLDPRRPDNAIGSVLPVDARPANGFGLHDVLGNVAEWTLDAWAEEPTQGLRAGDGLRAAPDPGLRTLRGGHYESGAIELRCAARESAQIELRDRRVGIRAVRAIDR